MDDRELLELAARACGILKWDHFWVDAGLNVGSDASPAIWNPLTDDGDALRLAVKLKMEVAIWYADTTIQTDETDVVEEKHRADPYAATRRAITRAAAAIAQEMTDD